MVFVFLLNYVVLSQHYLLLVDCTISSIPDIKEKNPFQKAQVDKDLFQMTTPKISPSIIDTGMIYPKGAFADTTRSIKLHLR